MRSVRTPTTLWQRMSRLVPAMHWELHILQVGLTKFAVERPWIGVPLVLVLLGLLWGVYWMLILVVIAVCLLTRLVHPLELRLRRR